jgi:hypothetical protein
MQNLDDFAKSDLDRLEKLADNFKWFNSQYDSLKKNYDNQYVAIQERQVLDSDMDLESLIKRLDIRTYNRSIAIDFVYN